MNEVSREMNIPSSPDFHSADGAAAASPLSLATILSHLPFNIYLVNSRHEVFTLDGTTHPDLGHVHGSSCAYCSSESGECPIRATLDDRQRRIVRLPAHMCGNEHGMELELIPLEETEEKFLLVIQRKLEQLDEELSRTSGTLERRVRQLDILNQVLASLQQHRDLDTILHILLTGLTFGKGLEFNRAFFFERKGDEINGRLAVGPLDGREADHIWTGPDLTEKSLNDLLSRPSSMQPDRPIQLCVEQIRFRVEDASEPLRMAMRQPGCTRLRIKDRGHEGLCLLEATGSVQSWVAPVRIPSKQGAEDWKGFLLVDNSITGREPTEEHLDALVSCAYHLGFALERARLNRELDDRLFELRSAYERLDQRQEQLVQAEKLAAVGRITGNLMHEIKTPLMSIGGFARLLVRETEQSSKAHRHAEVMLRECRRIETVLDALMDYSQPQILRRERVDLSERVRQVVSRVSESLADKQISVELEFKGEHFELDGDQLRLDQLIHVQLRNVLDLAESGQPATRVNVLLEEIPEGLRLSVADNGPGVRAAVVDSVFEPFVTGREGSLGLGLSHARDIAMLHGGTMVLVQPGRLGGAEFVTTISWRNHGETAVRG